jgi:hypothetical protein
MTVRQVPRILQLTKTWIPAMSSPTLSVDAHEAKLQPCERAIFTTAMSVIRNEADAEESSQENRAAGVDPIKTEAGN